MIKLIQIQIYLTLIISFSIILIFSLNSHNNKIHPLILISILLILLVISSFNFRIYFNNHWFSFLIFLIIVGGIIIIFLYFIRFINNIKTSIKWIYLKNLSIKLTIIIITFIIIILLIYSDNWILNFNEISSIINIFKNNNFNNLNLIYLFPKNYSTLISILYLFISLTIIVKICLIKKFTLRKFNYEKINF